MSETIEGRTISVDVHEVAFGGLKCLAAELPDVGVVLKLPDAPSHYPQYGDTEVLATFAEVACTTCFVYTSAKLLVNGRVLVFPYVTGSLSFFVVYDVHLVGTCDERHCADEYEYAKPCPKPTKWTLRYRVSCPRCREQYERAASRAFAEIERQRAERA